MSDFVFTGANTQEMIDKAKGKNPEKKLSKLEKMAQEMAKKKSKNKKERLSLYMRRELIEKLYTASMTTGVSVNDMIIKLIEEEVKDTVIDEEKVVEYKERHKDKGNSLRTNKNVESTSKAND